MKITHTIRERDAMEGGWENRKRKNGVSVGDTLVTLSDMRPVLFPPLLHASVIH